VAKTIGYGLVALLLLASISLCFLINLYLGLFVALLVIGTFVWVYGFNKKKVDRVMAEVADETGLSYIPSRVTYARLEGDYKGFETEVSVRADRDFGPGAIAATETGTAGMAAMDIRNYTSIRMRHGLHIPEEVILSKTRPRVVARASDIVLALPHVSNEKEEIVDGLHLLVKKIKRLAQ
jgi:hypothetical protein